MFQEALCGSVSFRDINSFRLKIPCWTSLDMTVDSHHVPGVRHEEVLSHMSRQQVEQDPLVVQLHLLHVVSLLLRLDGTHTGGEGGGEYVDPK